MDGTDSEIKAQTGPREVYLHVGAHRTGTTSFQFTLGQNAQTLAQQGLTVWVKSRGQVPNGRPTYGVTKALHKHANGHINRTKAVKRLSGWIARQPDADADKVLISDENFLGDMSAFFEGEGFYQGAGARLGVFADRFGAGLRRVTVVIRPVLDWIGSGAGYYALSGRTFPNSQLIELAEAETRGWADIVGEMRTAAPDSILTVVDYRNRGDDLALAAHFCPDARLTRAAEQRNASIPQDQMQSLQKGVASTDSAKRKFSQTDPDAQRWRPDWPAALQTRFAETYARDLERIAALPDVTLVRADAG